MLKNQNKSKLKNGIDFIEIRISEQKTMKDARMEPMYITQKHKIENNEGRRSVIISLERKMKK